ncbi:MAG: hypothetical protein IJ224_10265 [Lachnospiraceae bacterium]|nr:hypothetical protein [Lachnospiraceae bacterium]
MRRKIELFEAGLRLLYEWLFSVLCSYFIIVIFMGKKPDTLIPLALLIIYIASYVVRKNAVYNIWILIIHALLLAVLFLSPFSGSSKWVLAAIIIYQMSEAFLYERRGNFGNFNDVPWPTFFVSVIIYAYGFATKSSLLTTSAYVIPILLIIIYLLIIYIDGLKGYVEASKNVSGLPINKILTINTSIVFIIVLLLLAGIGLGMILGLDDALYKAFRALLYIISYIIFAIRLMLIFLFKSITRTQDDQITYEQNRLSGFASQHADDVVGILDIVYKVGAAILVIYILYKVAAWFIRLMMRKRIIAEDKVEDAVTYKKSISSSRVKKERKSIFSSETRFRKYYRERILRHRYDIRLDSSRTSNDIKDELYKNELDDITDITRAYNEIRYGNKKVTKDMLRLFDK